MVADLQSLVVVVVFAEFELKFELLVVLLWSWSMLLWLSLTCCCYDIIAVERGGRASGLRLEAEMRAWQLWATDYTVDMCGAEDNVSDYVIQSKSQCYPVLNRKGVLYAFVVEPMKIKIDYGYSNVSGTGNEKPWVDASDA
jgi:hypothetical protein